MKQLATILILMCSMAVQGQSVIDSQYYQNLRRSDKIDRVVHDSILGAPKVKAVRGKRDGVIVYNGPLKTLEVYDSAEAKWYPLLSFANQNGVITGGQVTWISGLTFYVSPASYVINGVLYNSAGGNITLNAADPTSPRIDLIALDSTGAIKITGTPAPDPQKPQVEPSVQLELTSVLVNAGATTPGNVSRIMIYDENIEWSTVTNNITANFNNTVNPFTGTKSVDVSSYTAATGRVLQFNNGSVFNIANYQLLTIAIRLKSTYANNATISLRWYNGSLIKSSVVTVASGSYNFVRTVTGVYQIVQVPVSAFTFSQGLDFGNAATDVSGLRITFNNAGGGMFLDFINLQQGVALTTQTGVQSFNERVGNIQPLKTDYSSFFLDTIYRRSDSVFGTKNSVERYLFKDSIAGGGSFSGIDSGAYRTLTQVNDSIITFNRANGIIDTLVIEVNGGSGGGGSGTVTQFNFTNSTGITGTVTNATTTPTLSLSIDTGAIANFAAKARSLFGGTYPIQYNNGLFNLDTTAGRWRSENYYNTKYLQNITGLVTQGTGISITGSGTSGSPYVINATGANADSTAAKIKRGTYAQRPLSPDTGQIYWQTDRLSGEWTYDGRRWNFSPEWNKVEWAETFTSPSPLVPKIAYLASGTGSGQTIIRERKFSSYLQLTTGTTTTGYSSGGVTEEETVSPIVLDSMIQYREWLVRLPQLSNGTDTYEAAVGWLGHQSQWNFGTLCFIYTHSLNGGNWSTRTRKFDNSASVTTKNSGVAAVANTWTKLAIEVNGYTETIYFYINDVLVTTHSTANGDNIPMPNASGVNSQYNFGIAKSAGTNARVLQVDEVLYYLIRREY